jgi:hypothetical protein
MLTDKNGKTLTTQRIQVLRKKHVAIPAAIHLVRPDRAQTCDAKRSDPTNFLLPDNRCCYCGLPQSLHK